VECKLDIGYEITMLDFLSEMRPRPLLNFPRPRRYENRSQDQDVETETTSLSAKTKLKNTLV